VKSAPNIIADDGLVSYGNSGAEAEQTPCLRDYHYLAASLLKGSLAAHIGNAGCQ